MSKSNVNVNGLLLELGINIKGADDSEMALKSHSERIKELLKTAEVRQWITEESKKPRGIWKRVEEKIKSGKSRATLERWVGPAITAATKALMAKAKKLYADGEGLPQAKIAKELGVSTSKIGDWKTKGFVNAKHKTEEPVAEVAGKNAEAVAEAPTGEVEVVSEVDALKAEVARLTAIVEHKEVKALIKKLGL